MFGLFDKAPLPETPVSRLRPCCFGKMPMHADFIRQNLTSRETAAFEKWLQEGVGCITRKHPKGWPPVYRNFPQHHFVLSGGEQDNNLMGSLVSSCDKSGRIYPFVALTVVGAPLLHAHRATLPMVFREYFEGTEALLQTAWEKETLARLTRDLDTLAVANPALQQRDLLQQQIELLRQLPMGAYWEGIHDCVPPDGREQFLGCFYDVMSSVLEKGAGRTHWGIRIPLPEQDNQTPFVVFWVQMVESILDDRFWRAHYFWTRGREPGPACLTLFFRPLPPSYLLPILNQGLEDNAVFDIGHEWRSLAAFRSRVDLRRLLLNDEMPMLEVLYRTGRREMLG